MTRLIFVGPTPAPVQAPPTVGFDEVTKGYVPWSMSSSVPWPPSKRTTLSSSSASLSTSTVSATSGSAGAKTIILTNGCGGLREGMRPGQPVLISDDINLTATSPIVGANFVDLTDLYSPRLRALCKEVDDTLEEGVYAQFPGPHYETPAEIRMARVIGADLVGMSTVLEAIAAREAGAEVLGISLVTNLAAGMTGEPLNHEEVLQAGRDSAARMGTLLTRVLGRL
ncbi:Purine nucleoside phosphorylase OS=Streptomyces tendae OX=1932 GN=GUR47_16200 PE=3 SV=1 [Streptomyces tendae]